MKLRGLLSCFVVGFLVLAVGPVAVAQVSDEHLAEFPEAFPQSSLEEEVAVASSGHLILFSPVREINNQIRSERMARLPVRGAGRLYQINRDASRGEAREHYERILQARGAQVLFECSGRSCGRSNVWANQIFDQYTLYGRDADQDYLVAAVTGESGVTWLTLVYTVTRGTQREYVWIEHLEAGRGAAIPGLDSINARISGPIIVPWQGGVTHRFDWSATDRRMLNNWVEDDGAKVVLSGFAALGEQESLEGAMDRARQAMESLSQVLDKSGISRSRQTLITIGPSVVIPSPERQGDRVEIVVIRGAPGE
ncbi:DUF4892 domain-containing protein [Marinobacter sp. NP-4(2019)]|uniref:DUF4892 domain-containing protein n=1 Tax=Marinobacter sp. NP-4(2019) TaxID=2488665 RepID=UPI000FC3D581|nr:DUF4892 domain-containing protein [Marinobacter sp. NP-4(2019)]AZT84048.1 DUF4892 domain-containing protein [Marinobacter sp. NP-4(2019)]